MPMVMPNVKSAALTRAVTGSLSSVWMRRGSSHSDVRRPERSSRAAPLAGCGCDRLAVRHLALQPLDRRLPGPLEP